MFRELIEKPITEEERQKRIEKEIENAKRDIIWDKIEKYLKEQITPNIKEINSNPESYAFFRKYLRNRDFFEAVSDINLLKSGILAIINGNINWTVTKQYKYGNDILTIDNLENYQKIIDEPIDISDMTTSMISIDKGIIEGRMINYLADQFAIIERDNKRVAYVVSSQEDKDLWSEYNEDTAYKSEDGEDMLWGAKWIINENEVPKIDEKDEGILWLVSQLKGNHTDGEDINV